MCREVLESLNTIKIIENEKNVGMHVEQKWNYKILKNNGKWSILIENCKKTKWV